MSAEYCTAHLHLLNQLIGSCPDLQLAHELHNALYASGFDRILLVSNVRQRLTDSD